MIIRFQFLVFLFFSILFVSCEADINLQNISNEVSLQPNLIVPVGSASITLGQILTRNDSLGRFEIGSDAEINYLRFDTSEFNIPNIDLLSSSTPLTRVLYPSPYGVAFIPPNFNLPPVTDNDSVSLGTNTNINGDRIDSIVVNSATISVIMNVTPDLASVPPANLIFTIIFPNGKIRMLDGSSSTISFTPTAYGVINNLTLSNFVINTSGGKTGIPIGIRIDAKSGNLPLSLSPETKITNNLSFSKLDYKVLYGNFKSGLKLANSFHQSIDFDKDMPNGLVKIVNPQVCITASSNIGTYLNFSINYIEAFQINNPAFTPIYANFNGARNTDIELKRRPVNPGDTVHVNVITLNKDCGGTNRFFESETTEQNMPDELQYDFSASLDSVMNGKNSSPSFIPSNAKIKVSMETIVPLNFSSGSYYEYTDSIPNLFVVIGNALNQYPYDNISSTALIFNVTNGLPVKTTFTFDLTDSLGKSIPTTFVESYVIQGGKTDVNGIVQPGQETKQTIQVAVSKDQLGILRKAKKLMYKVRIDGSTIDSNIHFTKTNTFDLKVGLFVKGDIKKL